MIDPIVVALAEERERRARSTRPDMVIPVDEELRLRGYCVDSATGKLVRVEDKPKRDVTREFVAKERAVDPRRERTVER